MSQTSEATQRTTRYAKYTRSAAVKSTAQIVTDTGVPIPFIGPKGSA